MRRSRKRIGDYSRLQAASSKSGAHTLTAGVKVIGNQQIHCGFLLSRRVASSGWLRLRTTAFLWRRLFTNAARDVLDCLAQLSAAVSGVTIGHAAVGV